MTTDAREVICSAILVHNKTFTCANICERTGLSRQLVFKHLTRLTERGFLEKNSHVYFPINREGLIETLLETRSHSNAGRFELTSYWLNLTALLRKKETTNLILMARALDLTDSRDMKTALVEELNKAIKSLQREKKYLTTGSRSATMVAKQLRKGYPKTFDFGNEKRTIEFSERTFIKELYDSCSSFIDSFTLDYEDAQIELIKKVDDLLD